MLHPSWGRHEQTTERRAHPAGNVRVWSSDRARAQPLLGRVSAHASGFPELTLGTECARTRLLHFFTTCEPHSAVRGKGLCERCLKQARGGLEALGHSAHLRNRLDESDPIIGSFDLGQAGTEVIPVVLLVAQEGGLFFLIELSREKDREKRSKPTAVLPTI